MKSAYVLIHGDLSTIPNLKKMMKQVDILICADGAAEIAYNQSLVPSVIVGDLDSIKPSVKKYFESKNVDWAQYPAEKDYTDAELAIQYARQKNIDEVIILGLLGKRVDHMITNLLHISQITANTKCRIIEGDQEIYFVRSSINLEGKKGDELSLIPLKQDCSGVTTAGLYYPLQNEKLPYGSSRGVSNVFIKKKITVELTEGLLLVIHRHL